MRTSYKESDVTFLLKDITGKVTPIPTSEREILIQQGRHYCEMLPLEYKPSAEYLKLYKEALANYAKLTAESVMNVADKIYIEKSGKIVLVSLARAGTPIGILVKKFLEMKYNLNVPHYSISIIRGRGIDHNAMKHILENHPATSLQFVDGWIGKGAILNTLATELGNYKGVSAELAVLSDPANLTRLCGTRKDFLIPSSCLNSTVSGLVSRTFLRDDIIAKGDFHGAAYYGELACEDLSNEFIDTIEKHFDLGHKTSEECVIQDNYRGIDEVNEIAQKFHIDDINLIKPGIGETTRVLLRRVPWKILVNSEMESPYLSPIFRLAKEKNVEVEEYPLKRYAACGIIKNLSADA